MARCLYQILMAVVVLVSPSRANGIDWQPLDVIGVAGPKAPVQLPDGAILSVRHAHLDGQTKLILARSDDGSVWGDVAVITSDGAGTDLGDCHLLRLRDGRLWCSYRRNRYRGAAAAAPSYAIEIAESRDDGRTWRKHSIVAEARHAAQPEHSRGLWSSFVLERRDGALQCYFDDEDTPARDGFPSHQWLVMKTWEAAAGQWSGPVVVSRAHDPAHLSRDGMPSIVELDNGQLFVVFESVQVSRPHANLIRCVTSDDGGKTWSWQQRERGVVYATPKPDHLALAPWMIRRRDGSLLVVFCTDEDRDAPGVSGTPPPGLRMDIKTVQSRDGGATWSASQLNYAGRHRNYLPGVAELADRSLQVHFVDYEAGGVRIVRGGAEQP